MPRISREHFYMEMAHLFSLRSTCLRGQVGCVIVRDKYVIGGGYNGAPPGMPHCLEVGCLIIRNQQGCQRAIHAETNAVVHAARLGIPCDDAELYCTHAMCATCAVVVASAGIRRVVYDKPYRLVAGLHLLDQLNVEVVKWTSNSVR